MPPDALNEETSQAAALRRSEDQLRQGSRLLEAANARLELLARAGEVLASSLDVEATLQSVAHLAVPQFADWCLIDLVEDRNTSRRVAVAHRADQDKTEADEAAAGMGWYGSLHRRHTIRSAARRGTSHVIATGQPELIPLVDDDILRDLSRDAAHEEMLRSLGIHSLISVPLCARGQIFGVLTFAACDDERANYDTHDLAFAVELGKRASMAIDNARLHRETESALAKAEAARAAAEAAARIKDEFLAILSHELRTPLTVAYGWLYLFRGEKLDVETKTLALDSVERALATQTRLVNELIETSRIADGTLRLESSSLALAPVVEEAIAALRAEAETKNITINFACEPGVRVRGDAGRLRQIVSNLLSNALKFSFDGSTVSLRLNAMDGKACLVVEDSGVGIAPEFLAHVFERFLQSEHSATRTQGGLGLGLAIARHFTEMHGGTLAAQSAGKGHGATFKLFLPLLEDSKKD